ncbi:MAG: hypothetical protein H7Z40_07935 [Phycisphaerae bacterium]|nr:hypothetical protein [Gemmatimonadaceae bacterium]
MNTKDHSFTRNGITYDCIARSIGLAKAPHRLYAWRVTVNGAEHVSLGYTGEEFKSLENRLAFEEAIIASVTSRVHQNAAFVRDDDQPLPRDFQGQGTSRPDRNSELTQGGGH